MRNSSCYVTAFGRAISPGTVTRAQENVKRHKQKGQLPLPPHLAVHPKRMKPTPRNPGCITKTYQYLTDAFTLLQDEAAFKRGDGLRQTPSRYRVRTADTRRKTLGFTPELRKALAWRDAAAKYGIEVEVFEQCKVVYE